MKGCVKLEGFEQSHYLLIYALLFAIALVQPVSTKQVQKLSCRYAI